jgi:hypothetical protein
VVLGYNYYTAKPIAAPAGLLSSPFPGTFATVGDTPRGVAVDRSDNVYVANHSDAVLVFNSTGFPVNRIKVCLLHTPLACSRANDYTHCHLLLAVAVQCVLLSLSLSLCDRLTFQSACTLTSKVIHCTLAVTVVTLALLLTMSSAKSMARLCLHTILSYIQLECWCTSNSSTSCRKSPRLCIALMRQLASISVFWHRLMTCRSKLLYLLANLSLSLFGCLFVFVLHLCSLCACLPFVFYPVVFYSICLL